MQFASFSYPRHTVQLPRAPLANRLARYRQSAPALRGLYCANSAYYQTDPCPVVGRDSDRSLAFYLGSDFQPGMRWQFADEVTGARIDHKGWFYNDCGETIRGLVFRLPRSRGFLAGWTMGEGMASALYPEAHDSEADAARMADEHARIAADRQREFEEAFQRELDAEQALADAACDQSGEH